MTLPGMVRCEEVLDCEGLEPTRPGSGDHFCVVVDADAVGIEIGQIASDAVPERPGVRPRCSRSMFHR